MSYTIKINKIKNSKVKDLDFDNIPLGRTFTDHMFICDYQNGKWQNPRVEPVRALRCYRFKLKRLCLLPIWYLRFAVSN